MSSVVTSTVPAGAYSALYDLSADNTFQKRVAFALAVVGFNLVAQATGPADPVYQSALAQLVSPSRDTVQRVVNRVLVQNITAGSTDVQIQAAVNALIQVPFVSQSL